MGDMVKKEDGKLLIEETSIAASGSASEDLGYQYLNKTIELAVSARVAYDASATSGVTVKIYSSPDGTNYDTDVLADFVPTLSAGNTAQKTILLDAPVRYLRITVVNDDSSVATGAVSVWVTKVNRY